MSRTTKPQPYVAHGYRVSMVREEPGVTMEAGRRLGQPEDAVPALRAYLGPGWEREVFFTAMLTVRHRLIGFNTVSIGCLTSSLVHPREVFKPAILASAAALVLCHNHPSGDPEPSQEDLQLTRRLVSAGTLLGIDVLDHIVLGDPGWVSLKMRGVI